ncbi:phage gene 29 protein family protein [Nocardia takedensis]
MALPAQQDCDQDNPEDAFVWAFVGLPGPRNGPMLVPQQQLRKWSRHLWELGFRHHPEHQELEYHPATPEGEHWLFQAGSWVPVGTPRPPSTGELSVADLSAAERQELVRQLRESGDLAHLVEAGTVVPDVARAGVFDGTSR